MAWQTYEKADRNFDVLIQEQEADCGLCCVAMIVNLLGQGKPSSNAIRAQLQSGAYKPSTQDRSGFKPTILAAVRPEVATHSLGTYLQNLQQVLTKYKINSAYNGPAEINNVQTAIKTAYAGKPIICHVSWTNGGGHWVVITHASGNSHYVLDPYYGLRVNSSDQYYEGLTQSPHSAGSVQSERYGTWTGEWLKII